MKTTSFLALSVVCCHQFSAPPQETFGHYPDDHGSQQENEMSQGCAKQSEENDGLEQQLKDAQYTRTGEDGDDCGDHVMTILMAVAVLVVVMVKLSSSLLFRVGEQVRGIGSKTTNAGDGRDQVRGPCRERSGAEFSSPSLLGDGDSCDNGDNGDNDDIDDDMIIMVIMLIIEMREAIA